VRYLLIVHADPQLMAALSPAEHRAHSAECAAYDQALIARGKLIAAEALSGPKTARIVRTKGGKPVVTDGPYAESKEVLCGFLFVEAATFEEAVDIAHHCPMSRVGAIEVRPQMSFRAGAEEKTWDEAVNRQ
jgi:hypothetical protein